jgi:hypothetical protein
MYGMIRARMNVVKAVTTGTIGYVIATNGVTTFGTNTNGTGNYTFFFNDGITFSFPSNSSECINRAYPSDSCKGWIDVNGAKAPNKVIKCTTGSGDTCEVTNPTDVYPVVFYDQTLLPNSDAGRAVLYGK